MIVHGNTIAPPPQVATHDTRCPVAAIILLESDFAVAASAAPRLRDELAAAYEALARGHRLVRLQSEEDRGGAGGSLRRADVPQTSRGDAAAATWIFRGHDSW